MNELSWWIVWMAYVFICVMVAAAGVYSYRIVRITMRIRGNARDVESATVTAVDPPVTTVDTQAQAVTEPEGLLFVGHYFIEHNPKDEYCAAQPWGVSDLDYIGRGGGQFWCSSKEEALRLVAALQKREDELSAGFSR